MDEVLEYWFGAEPTTQAEMDAKIRRWFLAGAAVDGEIIAKFGALVEAAVRGELDAWADSARGRLALVILLDQLTRHTYRGQARMYAGDEKAQQLALDAFARGLDGELSWIERLFLSMPLLHSESPSVHERYQPIGDALCATVPPIYAKMADANREQRAKYLGIVQRFGRFPHRNAILGRAATPEEEAFVVEMEAKMAPAVSKTV